MPRSTTRFGVVLAVFCVASVHCSAQTCPAPVRIEQVSSTVLECVRATLPQHRMSFPSGSVGVLTGPGGAQASFAWDQQHQILIFSSIKPPSLVSCAAASADIADFGNSCAGTDVVTRLASDVTSETWRIDSPDVRKSDTAYPQIPIHAGDSLSVTAGGCAQTGGHGDTWRLYVDPRNDNLHHGLIKVPGQSSSVRLKDIRPGQVLSVPANLTGDMQLHLGYEDSDFSDNGYWGRDPGPDRECQEQPNAWAQIIIKHAR
jgi:hypothetical protein